MRHKDSRILRDEVGYIAKTSKRNINTYWFLLSGYCKMLEERDELRGRTIK